MSYKGYTFEESDHGVDIFLHGIYHHTLLPEDGEQLTAAEWRSRAHDWVDGRLQPRSNDRRVLRFQATLQAYVDVEGEYIEESSITDLATDFLHWLKARSGGKDNDWVVAEAQEILRQAAFHLEEESPTYGGVDEDH